MIRILHGDCREVLKTLPDCSVHACITSPPYWGLRSYLPAGHDDKHMEIGSEPTVDAWVQTMVEVFREVRRVLRDDGTLWINLGDSYAGSWGAQSRDHAGEHAPNVSALSANQVKAAQIRESGTGSLGRTPGLKPKDLIGQPWRVAFAMQADGWWLRQEIIWGKKNPMPESIRDRFTKAHEHVFLLSKSSTYYFDFDAVQEDVEGGAHARRAAYKTPDGWDTRTGQGGHGSYHAEGREKGQVLPQGVGRRQGPPGNPAERKMANADSGTKNNESFDEAMAVMPATRNPRSVRWLASEPFKGAHFATYPPALIEPFVLAGCPEGGTVLDPFGGSGTTGMVADRHHRNAILIDLDARNIPMATDRIKGDSSLFAEVIA